MSAEAPAEEVPLDVVETLKYFYVLFNDYFQRIFLGVIHSRGTL